MTRAGQGWLLPVFGVVSLACVGLGAWVASGADVPAALWGRNLGAWLVGGLLALALAYMARRSWALVVLGLTPILLAATFLGPGLEGVHRWLALGPLQFNAAMLLLPAAAVSLAIVAGRRLWPWLVAVLSLVVLVIQPDASQATALALAMALIAVSVLGLRPLALLIVGITAITAALAWMRPDSLEPVPEVEGIVGLAFNLSPLAGAAAVLLLAALVAAPLLASRTAATPVRAAALGLAACFLGWAAAPWLGAFPVPLIGMGVSPIIGAWLGVGLLAAMARRET